MALRLVQSLVGLADAATATEEAVAESNILGPLAIIALVIVIIYYIIKYRKH